MKKDSKVIHVGKYSEGDVNERCAYLNKKSWHIHFNSVQLMEGHLALKRSSNEPKKKIRSWKKIIRKANVRKGCKVKKPLQNKMALANEPLKGKRRGISLGVL